MTEEDYFLIVRKIDNETKLAYVETREGNRIFYTQLGEKLLTEHGDNVWFEGAKFNYLFDERGNFNSVKLFNPKDGPVKSLE